MNVLSLQVFVSLMLVLSAVVALLYSVKQGDHEHADRLSLLPLDDDDATPPLSAAPQPASSPSQKTNPNKGE
jgi:nitrogen fixation-related uncharacterized protein